MRFCYLLLVTVFSINTVLYAAPISYIKLNGNFYEMGQQYANQKADVLQAQLKLSKKEIVPDKPYNTQIFKFMVGQSIQLAKSRYPKEMMDFIQGEADSDGAKKNHLSLDDFIYLDQNILMINLAKHFHEMTPALSHCTFFGLNNKGVIVGRNYDFPKAYLHATTTYPELIQLSHTDKTHYPNQVLLATSSGIISAITVMNEKGNYLSVNAGNKEDIKFMVFKRPSYFSKMVLAMFSLNDFKALKNWVNSTPTDVSYILNIAGKKKQQLASVETIPFDESKGHYTPSDIPMDLFKARFRYADSTNTVEPEKDHNNHFLVAANTFRLTDWQTFLGHDYNQQTASFSKERYDNTIVLAKKIKKAKMKLAKKLLKTPLTTLDDIKGPTVKLCENDPYFADNINATYYSLVFNTRNNTLHIRYQQTDKAYLRNKHCQSTWTPWFKLKHPFS